MSPNQPSPSTPPPPTPHDASLQRKKLVLSTLAAAGAFNFSAWDLQAHGNRSSHQVFCTLALRTSGPSGAGFTPDDYVALRQSADADAASAPLTQELLSVQAQLDTLQQAAPDAKTGGTYQLLEARKRTLENAVRYRPLTRQVMDFLARDDAAGAAAVIEGKGDAERVMREYGWVMQDMLHVDRDGLAITAEQALRIAPVARAAADYAHGILQRTSAKPAAAEAAALRLAAADLLFNVASFLAPDKSGDDPRLKELLDLAMTAAKTALDVRVALHPVMLETAQDPVEIDAAWEMRTRISHALWKVGFVAYSSGDRATAADYFQKALAKAEEGKDLHAIVWSKVYLGSALRDADPVRSKQLRAEALELAPKVTSSGVPGEKSTIPWLLKHLPE